MQAEATIIFADEPAAMSDRETALAQVLESLCDSVQVSLNPRLRSPSAVITAGDARTLQSLFDLSARLQELLKDITCETGMLKRN